jgi:hypothetical protein
MELRDIPGAEYSTLRLFPGWSVRVICLLPLCVPVLIGHDIRSILFASRFPSGFFYP